LAFAFSFAKGYNVYFYQYTAEKKQIEKLGATKFLEDPKN